MSLFFDRIKSARKLVALPEDLRVKKLVGFTVPILKEMEAISKKNGAKFYVFLPIVGANNSMYVGGYLSRSLAGIMHMFEPNLELEESGEKIFSELARADLSLLPRNEPRIKEWAYRRYMSFAHPEDFHTNEKGDLFLSDWIFEDFYPLLSKKI
jgi:hypothetical protein